MISENALQKQNDIMEDRSTVLVYSTELVRGWEAYAAGGM
jgi:hypothetical protein